MIARVQTAFDVYDKDTLSHIWGHLFACYNEILRVDGGNEYAAPHTGVRKRAKLGQSSEDRKIDLENYNRLYMLYMH